MGFTLTMAISMFLLNNNGIYSLVVFPGIQPSEIFDCKQKIGCVLPDLLKAIRFIPTSHKAIYPFYCYSRFIRRSNHQFTQSHLPTKNGPEKHVHRRFSRLVFKVRNFLKQAGRFLLTSAGRLAARLPKRILRIMIGGFVKELKSRQLNWEELHYILMDDLTLEDIYQLIVNDRSLNQTSTDYGGIVHFLDAKAKLEATKILPELDKDKDGDVSPREVLEFISKSIKSRLALVVETIDTDGDGRVSVSDVLIHMSESLRDVVFREKKDPPRPP